MSTKPESYEPLKSTEGLVESGDLTDKEKTELAWPSEELKALVDLYNTALENAKSMKYPDGVCQAMAVNYVRDAATQAAKPRWIPLEERTPKARTCVLLGRGKLTDPATFQAKLFCELPEGDYYLQSWTHWYPIEEPRP